MPHGNPASHRAGAHWVAILALVSTFVAALPLRDSRAGEGLAVEPIVLLSGSGEHSLQVEIADTDATRARGLMFRRALAPDRGMLFLYETQQPLSMWMRNTYISLDMVFIRADGTIDSIARDTEPFSEAVITSGGSVIAVLEIAAGQAKRLELKPGDEVRHAHFSNVQ